MDHHTNFLYVNLSPFLEVFQRWSWTLGTSGDYCRHFFHWVWSHEYVMRYGTAFRGDFCTTLRPRYRSFHPVSSKLKHDVMAPNLRPRFLPRVVFFFMSVTQVTPLASSIRPRAAPANYFAQGDSYGYASSLITSLDWFYPCFMAAYGLQLNTLFSGAFQFSHEACSRATTETI